MAGTLPLCGSTVSHDPTGCTFGIFFSTEPTFSCFIIRYQNSIPLTVFIFFSTHSYISFSITGYEIWRDQIREVANGQECNAFEELLKRICFIVQLAKSNTFEAADGEECSAFEEHSEKTLCCIVMIQRSTSIKVANGEECNTCEEINGKTICCIVQLARYILSS